MKLKKSDVNLLLGALGVLLVVGIYFWAYNPAVTKTEEMNVQNEALRAEVNRLEELANNRQEYETKTAEWKADMDDIKAQFAASYLPEDEILYVNDLENRFAAEAATISMPGSSLVDIPYTPAEVISAGVPASAPEEGQTAEDGEVVEASVEVAPVEPPVRMYGTPVSITYTASYDAIKELLEDMNQDDMRKSIDNITMAFDGETGGITGSMSFTMYSMTGTDAVYEVPSIPGISFGTKDIFNSSSKAIAIKNAKAEQN